MARRRMTVKRLDPWSVLKFGAVANVVVFAILMLVAGIIWFIVDRLQLVDQVCGIATDVGFTSCGINAPNLFRALSLLGAMGVVVFTAVLVFAAFLYNLISDLTGGLTIGVVEEGVVTRSSAPQRTSIHSPTPRPESFTGEGRHDDAIGGPQATRSQVARSQSARGPRRAEGEELFSDG